LRDSFAVTIKRIDPSCKIADPKLSPAGGALLIAYDLAGIELDWERSNRILACAEGFDELRP
jgi:hypothetical protein